jgi:hypothetical protein
MRETDFNFPVLCFTRDFIRVREDYDTLARTTRAGVKNGMFDNLLVVDSTETAVRVRTAKKLRGIGLL